MIKAYCASVATETNTFSPLRTDFSDFCESFYAPPGEHPETPTLCSAVFPSLRSRAARGEIELVEGTAAWAEPGGLINDQTWVRLKSEILQQVSEAMPLDVVVLGLHGAMIAENCVDCEGELLEQVREIVGSKVIIGVTFDPHSHLSQKRVDNADVIHVFKEFPHTDFVRTGEECVDLTLRAAQGEIVPVMSVFDVRMIDILPTSRNPMRSFVDKMLTLETAKNVLSVSAVHGFMAGDSPDLGAKVIVITDNDGPRGEAIAKQLGMELFSFRGSAKPAFLRPQHALEKAVVLAQKYERPVVIADVWDNPGGGVAGDSTILARMVIDQNLQDVAFGTIWDPMAVRLCIAAGEGARINLRFGGKTSAFAGEPIDACVLVKKIVRKAVQSFGSSVVPLGDCVCISFDGLQFILNSNRSQAFSPDLFTNLGVDVLAQKMLIVKSTNHFHDAFLPIASHILYAAVDGPYPSDPRTTEYKNVTRSLWPIVENPHTVHQK